jgi:HEAT repeat protein
VDDLLGALRGDDEPARSLARQFLPREGAAVVPKLLPLLNENNPAVRDAAFNVLADIANEVSAPGREAERGSVARQLMELVRAENPGAIKRQGLRLLPIVIPPDADVSPVAALLDDPKLRERARESLEEMATPRSTRALREQLPKADSKFACALLNSLGRLRDRDGLEAIAARLKSDDPAVRVAAARALAWTGDPAYLQGLREVASAADDATRGEAHDAGLRLLDAMGAQEAHRADAIAGYRAFLASSHGPVKDAALAGLGRCGDASCVATILDAIRDEEPPTLLVGLAALGHLNGSEVSRLLVETFPKLPPRMQSGLIPILGTSSDPLVLPILRGALHSDQPGSRTAALQALADSELPQALDLLAAEAKSGDEPHRAKARELLDRLTDRLIQEGRDVGGLGEARQARLLATRGIVGRWWVVGPFDLGEKNEGWATTYINEPNVNVVARYMAGKVRRQWKPVVAHDPNGKIDLRQAIADRDRCVGYAYAEIELDQPAEAVLLLGVDDSEKVWVNGASVFEQFVARGLQVDQDRVPVKLKAGTNTILLKVYQNSLGWEFCARLVSPDGHPLPIRQKTE